MPSHRGHRTERLVRPRHVHQEVALAGDLLLRLLAQLDPGPRVHVLEASRVTRVGRDVVADMIASERYVVPLGRGEVGARETGAPVVGDAPLGIHDVFQHPVQHERSEEHTSELQSLAYLVCRLLLEKKKKKKIQPYCHLYRITYPQYQHPRV